MQSSCKLCSRSKICRQLSSAVIFLIIASFLASFILTSRRRNPIPHRPIEIKHHPPGNGQPHQQRKARINNKDYHLKKIRQVPLHLLLSTSTTIVTPNVPYDPPPPVNVDNFTVLITPSRVCSDNNIPKIVAYVYCTADVQSRKLIRSTWANATKYSPGLIQTFFVLGRPPLAHATEFEKVIQEDAKNNGDILYVDFQDAYDNLTYKAVSAMEFILARCKGVQYVIKADDDTVVNVPKVARILSNYSSSSLTLVCKMYYNSIVVRYPHKFQMDPRIYPVRKPDTYPPYCFGNGLSMTFGMLERLYSRVPAEPKMWIDDVYVTGMLARNISNVTRHDLRVGTYSGQSLSMVPKTLDFAFSTSRLEFVKISNLMLLGYNKTLL